MSFQTSVRYRRSCSWHNSSAKIHGRIPSVVSSSLPDPQREDSTGGVGIGTLFLPGPLGSSEKILSDGRDASLDIGSRIDGFVAHLLVFMPVTLVDLRRLDTSIEGLTFVNDDATTLGRFSDESVESISSLHAAEHFGLGRYGDAVDATACFRFIDSLKGFEAGWPPLFLVPIGRERVGFNAHRVFEVRTILSAFATLRLVFVFVRSRRRSLTYGHRSQRSPVQRVCLRPFRVHEAKLRDATMQTLEAKDIARRVCPRVVWALLRFLWARFSFGAFKRRTVRHRYGENEFSVELIDFDGARWYDHDFEGFPEIDLLKQQKLVGGREGLQCWRKPVHSGNGDGEGGWPEWIRLCD